LRAQLRRFHRAMRWEGSKTENTASVISFSQFYGAGTKPNTK